MNKIYAIIFLLFSVLIFSGCGQDLEVTVYNATGITAASGWLAMHIQSEGVDKWGLPTTYALDDSEVDETNSFSVKLKENNTIYVGANGEYVIAVTDGKATMQPFTVPQSSATVYGGFPSAPKWYAAINMESVSIYKK